MTIFRGMDILKNDVTAILGQIFDMKLQENKRHSTMTPGLDKNGYHFYIIYIRFSESKSLRKNQFIHKSEVISLRTSGKRLPGKKLAVYIGVVIAVLVLLYNLTKDLSFILISDKEGTNFT